ncbi:hypothetical protein H7691_12455 [Stenotrophomonas sp. CW117]|uniref:hypothetical protein n=1 Tax=Stenotrophomonas TaxID=40323 RepID=UPI0007033905|nr:MULTISPECIES: hypothetical protein [Stenotrophomonas]KRG86168.1 hypothetical protein ABB33_05125 [Stenotrophomonas acidaminiphila]QOF97449.1 hypothetical protein H7691_12455 [Stenotrophomonas sp. CW117]
MAKTITLTLVTLLIDRDASTKLPTTVPEYEQSILEEIYGEELVTELETKDIEVEDFDAGIAFAGLVKKYGGNSDSDTARARYFNRQRDLEKFIDSRQPSTAKAAAKATTSAPAKTAAEKKAEKDAAKAAAKAGKDAAVATDFTELLAGDVASITEKLKDLSDADLVAIEAAETEGQGREDVLAAIDDESESRKQ